jgi:Flp pilus assembly protein TadB
MDAQDRIQMLKQIPPISKEEKSRKLKSSIILFFATLISILFLVYAFIQKQEADKQKEIAVRAMTMAEEQRAEAEQQRRAAEAARIEAVNQQALAAEALANCEKNKK